MVYHQLKLTHVFDPRVPIKMLKHISSLLNRSETIHPTLFQPKTVEQAWKTIVRKSCPSILLFLFLFILTVEWRLVVRNKDSLMLVLLIVNVNVAVATSWKDLPWLHDGNDANRMKHNRRSTQGYIPSAPRFCNKHSLKITSNFDSKFLSKLYSTFKLFLNSLIFEITQLFELTWFPPVEGATKEKTFSQLDNTEDNFIVGNTSRCTLVANEVDTANENVVFSIMNHLPSEISSQFHMETLENSITDKMR